MEFSGQVAVITGAAGNVGAAIARELAGRGAKLTLVDVNATALEALAANLPVSSTPLLLGGVDLRRDADADRVARDTVARFGRIDALANTVGAFRMGRVDAEAAEQWPLLIELNALSALLLCKAIGPVMAKAGYGRMVHVAAGAALRGGAGMSAYSAAKAALVRIVESVADEYRAQGVSANCIAPTTIDTPQNRAAMPGADTSDWLPPEAIARAVAALLSREAGAITGALIPLAKVGG
jgi:NAD(P)-dependent dehydrogenase (short-subunit alcohol dehydrogenase family)